MADPMREEAFTLRDGRTVLLRPGRMDDAESTMRNANRIGREQVYLMLEEVPNLKEEQRWLSGFDGERNVLFVAVADGEVVGAADCHAGPFPKDRHVGGIGIAIQDGWREAGLAPAVLDRDSDAADMAVLREGPGVTIRRSDDLPVCDRDEEHVALAVEAGKPPLLLLQVRHLFEHEVDLFSADAVRVAHRGLRVIHPAGPQHHRPPVPEGEGFLSHRVRHEAHSGNLSRTSGRRRSPEAR